MNSTKFIRQLRLFEKEEIKQFGYFLESPYFFNGRKEEKLLELFRFIKKYHPKFENKKLTKEHLFSHLFPERCYNEQALQQVTTRFNKALDHFIDISYQKKVFGYPAAGMGLATYYEEKKMADQFEKAHQAAGKVIEKNKSRGPKDLWYNFLLARQLTNHQGNQNLRYTDLNLPETLLRLDYFFLVIKLELACAFQNQKKHQLPIDSQGGLAIFEAILPLLEDGLYREEPLVDLLYRTYLLLQEKASVKEFEDLKSYFEKNAKNLALTQRLLVHSALRNFCSRQINAGQERYLEELMKLYQEGLPLDVLYSNEKLPASTFQNMVTVGLRLKQFDWVAQFLEEHRHRILSKEDPESFYNLAKASLFFKQKQFDAALEHLTYKFSDTYSKMIARRLEIQINYELKTSILDSKIHAFKVYVFRTSKSLLTEVQKDGYTNFIDALKQIMHPSTRFNSRRIDSIREKLLTKRKVSEKKWLLEKLEELGQ